MDIINQFPNLVPLNVQFYKEYPYSKSLIRRTKIMLLQACMRNYPPFTKLSEEQQNTKIIYVETSCYNASIIKFKEKNRIPTWKCIEFIKIYTGIISRDSQAIDCDSEIKSKFLIKLVTAGNINFDSIGRLPLDELCPEINADLKKYISDRYNQFISKKISSLYECDSCGKSKVTYVVKQLRGGDEGSSTIITCTNCPHRWIIH